MINNCTITGNSGTGNENGGGGVYCYSGGVVNNSTINGNSAKWSGGGVYCKLGGTVIDCTTPEKLVKNKASYTGAYLKPYLVGIRD